MKRVGVAMLIQAIFGISIALAVTQSQQGAPASSLVSKSTKAIGYQVGGGSTMVDLKGTTLMSQAHGVVKVEAQKGITKISAQIMGLDQPTKFGTEFMTYVLWVVTPDGSTNNVGELLINKNGEGKLQATTQLQTFSLILTAEPYFSVRQPSELVVLENEVREDTMGKIFEISDYKLMKRGQYQKMGNPLALILDLKRVPLEMYEARNAAAIARSQGAEQYAADIFAKAETSLKTAEDALARKANKKDVVSSAREAVQFSEDARALAVERQEEARIAREREQAAAKARAEAEAKAAAEVAEAKRRAEEESRRQAELAAAREAQMKAEAEAAALKAKAEADAAAARAKAEADAAAAKAAAEQEALRAKEEAARVEAERARQEAERAEREKQELRAKLLEQFNRILETRDTPRGLVVTMADVLFDSGKYDLRPVAREKLARLSGIVLAHPGLTLQVEGHTDSTGSEDFNQKLSEQRASTTRDYLVQQGLPDGNITATGFGETMPIADNQTAEGRQKNRRVEIIVGGEVIGAKIGK